MPINPGPLTAQPGPSSGTFVLKGFRWGFALIVALFFLWAIANNFNDILIRQFQKSLGLTRAEAGFIQFVFYIGYFVVALPAGLLTRRLGYRAGVLVGLGLYATGALLFYPASLALSYPMFLFALFVIASGAACLETTANAYIGAFGSASTAVQRLNLAQAFNGLGAFIAPIVGGLLIFSGVEHSATALASMTPAELAAYRAAEASTVQLPYVLLAVVALAIAGAVTLARLPDLRVANPAPLGPQVARLLRHRALRGAIVAQFFYVGAQVGIWSFFIDFVKDVRPEVSERNAAYMLSASLLLFTAGRFIGTGLMSRVRPATLLGVYAVANVVLCAIAASGMEWAAVVALMLTSFFMSIMFPTIFALGVEDLGEARPLGSSSIIMAIIGGAVFPPLMGLLAGGGAGMPGALVLPLACFVVIAVYAHRVRRAALREDVAR
ncbi:MFS transporter, FHS family, L-fucose permease [Sphingomonas gellani]|uniref:MFS transporter, FHS family, L-fucose permease n=1 Tax=Sphingomonas gellani TaxID=1166340 RepID=A0A1H8DVZ1_9SPHN|nr:L-fucose:H+ symporter permease [Sphingomonas gellani]SEN11390.1 MFS transporter, FHS family, L-fucose permease [Sphingomonas gellani]